MSALSSELTTEARPPLCLGSSSLVFKPPPTPNRDVLNFFNNCIPAAPIYGGGELGVPETSPALTNAVLLAPLLNDLARDLASFSLLLAGEDSADTGRLNVGYVSRPLGVPVICRLLSYLFSLIFLILLLLVLAVSCTWSSDFRLLVSPSYSASSWIVSFSSSVIVFNGDSVLLGTGANPPWDGSPSIGFCVWARAFVLSLEIKA